MGRHKKLVIFQNLAPDELRKLIEVKRPNFSKADCALCMSGEEVRLIVAKHTGEILTICKPCLEVLAKRNISN